MHYMLVFVGRYWKLNIDEKMPFSRYSNVPIFPKILLADSAQAYCSSYLTTYHTHCSCHVATPIQLNHAHKLMNLVYDS